MSRDGSDAVIGLVVPSLTDGGGVPSVARFLYRVIEDSDRYEPYLVSLAMSSEDGASVRLLAPRSWFRGVQAEEGAWQGRRYSHVGAYLTEFEFMRYAPRSALARRLERADLIQVVAGTPAWTLPTVTCSSPVVLHVATLAASERTRRQENDAGPKAIWRRAMTRITQYLDRVGLRRVERVFVMNRWMQRKAEEFCGPDRVVFAPPGVDVSHFSPLGTQDRTEEVDYILSVGRFGDPRKNVELLFRAYAELASRVRPPPLWLAGKTSPPESAWNIADSEGIRDRVRYLGRVSDSEIARLYRGATVFALSSDEEGFGLVLLEAMASGCPVVSTDCGGPGDVLDDGDDGFLVPVGNEVALADAMETLLKRPGLREKFGRRARQKVVSTYSEQVAGERFLRTYDDVLGRGRSRDSGGGTTDVGAALEAT